MKQTQIHVLDLTIIDGNGAFECPECRNAISPDDCSEEAYSIIEPKVSDFGLEELEIRCNKCGSQLHLTGFSILQKLTEKELKKIEKERRKENSCYISHI